MLLDIRNLTKSYSSDPLFDGISFSINEGERIGLIGPNGAGKSTLLKILTDRERADAGTVVKPPAVTVEYLMQSEKFEAGKTVEEIMVESLSLHDLDDVEKQTRARILLSRLGFEDKDQKVETLSGGWQKRLSIARQLVKEPDLLLLDEPTNHLDIAGIKWLEDFLTGSRLTFIVVSHDRYLLEKVTTRIIELSPVYEKGYFSVDGCYSDFLEKRQDLIESQKKFEKSLANKVREEITWLRKGPRARATKANYRIKAAGEMIDTLADTRRRMASDTKVEIEFSGTGRRTKQLIVAEEIEKTLGGKKLFSDVNLVISPGDRIGIVGNNGSGKTTLMRILGNEGEPDKGLMKFYDKLRSVHFQQDRSKLDKTKSLKEALAPEGDIFEVDGHRWHLVGWAKRFLFPKEKLPMAVSELSGGEQARILIANLMRTPSDVLLLDEPTNDLDIPSIEVLEESLRTFPGAVILITHDRHMLDNLCNHMIGLHDNGDSGTYASVSQWLDQDSSYDSLKLNKNVAPADKAPSSSPLITREEKKELSAIEKKIEKQEAILSNLQVQLEDSEIASNVETLQEISGKVTTQEAVMEALYHRWEELGNKQEADDERVRLTRLG